MKILHIASFDGNIGDAANHSGFYCTLDCVLEGRNYSIDKIEIREFYRNWNSRHFDEEFVEWANKYDLIIIGGGGFFRVEWDDSATGTTIDISKEVMDKIRTPIIFNGLGCYINERTTVTAIEKFKNFLDYCIAKKDILLTLRNDGAINNVCKICGEKYREKILTVPDGGFFIKNHECSHAEINKDEKYLAINIAGDHESIQNEGNRKKIAFAVEQLLREHSDIRVVFVPHIYRDLEAIYNVMKYIPDQLTRTRISCSPYLNGQSTDGIANFDVYAKAIAVFGMRFHCNVCSIALDKPVVGFGDDMDICEAYESVGSGWRYKSLSDASEPEIYDCLEDMISNKDCYYQDNKRIMDEISCLRDNYVSELKGFLECVNA